MDTVRSAKTVKDISLDEAMAKVFKEDPAYAEYYIKQILLDGTKEDIEVARRQWALYSCKV